MFEEEKSDFGHFHLRPERHLEPADVANLEMRWSAASVRWLTGTKQTAGSTKWGHPGG